MTDGTDPLESRDHLDVFRDPPGSLSRLFGREPKDADGWLRLGDELAANGQLEEALARYRKATELDPQLIRAWLRKAEAYESLARETAAGGPAKSAIKAYVRVTELDPANVAAWLGQARLLDDSVRNRRRALRAYSKVTELDPRNAEAWRRTVSILKLLGEKAKAAEVRAQSQRHLSRR